MSTVKGVYVLVVSVSKNIRVKVGALGSIDFENGLYAYVGSAQNGLEKRIARHLRKAKRKFWHIDYLLDNEFVSVVKLFYKEAEKPEECRVARKMGERCFPVVDFGCSDCGCVSHLFMLKDPGCSRSFMAFLTANFTRAAHEQT
jgi:Uri superfamily endonuclease